jgi:hypothetical protein
MIVFVTVTKNPSLMIKKKNSYPSRTPAAMILFEGMNQNKGGMMSARRRRSGGGPEGGALACPSASLYLHVVGDGNIVAVPGLTR